MEFVDKHLKCVDCDANFVFSAGEQLFFREKGFVNDPKRCKPCKALRANGKRQPRPETKVKCAICGRNTIVPFVPRRNEPVLCRECFFYIIGRLQSHLASVNFSADLRFGKGADEPPVAKATNKATDPLRSPPPS